MDDEQRRGYHAIGDLLGSKWTFHVLGALAESCYGFNALKREVGGITAKTLSARLSELRCLGFIKKGVHPTSPPSTTYTLTDAGRELIEIVTQVEDAVELVECRDGDCAVAVAVGEDCTCEC